MEKLEKLEKEISDYNDKFNKAIFYKFCNSYNFIKGEKTRVGGCYGDFCQLCDHLFLFEKDNGEKYYTSNTYMKTLEIVEVLRKYELYNKSLILGIGFWNPDSTMIMFNYKQFKNVVKKTINHYY